MSTFISGTVIHGLGNGQKLGFPTANIEPDVPLELGKGVYAVRVNMEGKAYNGMLYVGTRPTLGLESITYEIHLFGIHKKLYGKKLAFRVIRKMREEKRFPTPSKLIEALQNDKKQIQQLLSPPVHAKARKKDIPKILEIIGQAQQRMKNRNLDQWQNGYPDEAAILNDIEKGVGHTFLKGEEIVAYAAIVFDPDPFYQEIDGRWISSGEPYINVHRIAIHDTWLRHGFAQHIIKYAEKKAVREGVHWFRIDTHHDNIPMRNMIREAGFTFCGIVQVRDGQRMAYEKRLL